MGLDCEYPNSCDCGCQDEPRHVGCKCCGRETEHSDDCLIPENARLRAALQKAEAERDEMERKLNRYLAAMTEWVETGDAAFEAARRALIRPEDELPPDVMRGVENRAIRAENAIRTIVEEARRG